MRIFDRIFGNNKPDAPEIIELRQQDSKTFDLGGKRRRLIKCICPLHYNVGGEFRDGKWHGGEWHDIDLMPYDDGEFWVIDRAPYILKLHKEYPYGTYESRATGFTASFEHPGLTGVQFEGDDAIYWTSRDKQAVINIRPAQIRIRTLLLSDKAKPEIEWKITGGQRDDYAVDAEENPAEIIDGRFTGRVSKMVDETTRRRAWVYEPVWPVRIGQ